MNSYWLKNSTSVCRQALSALACMGLLTIVSGCGQAPPPEFSLNMQGLNPGDFVHASGDSKDDVETKDKFIQGRKDIATALYAMFGTPDKPYVFPESGLDLDKINVAAGPAYDPQGKQRGLYRLHCAHCHGINGDGAGPTAAFLNPYPRDYRKGQFKFKSTHRAAAPTNEDLMRILVDGINGTAMPSFMLLPTDEREALIEYVKYLTIRGECETYMREFLYVAGEDLPTTKDELVANILQPVVTRWADASNQIITPADRPEMSEEEKQKSIAAGRTLYFDAKKGQCVTCHGPTQLGDGENDKIIDVWNEPKKGPEQIADIYRRISEAQSEKMPDAEYPNADARAKAKEEFENGRKSNLKALYAELDIADTWLLPKQQLKPRNLRMGIYRFGRSPADIYRRIYAGINGTPMPGAGGSGGNKGSLTTEEIWTLVDYVKTLPYLPMSQPMGVNPGDVHSTAIREQN